MKRLNKQQQQLVADNVGLVHKVVNNLNITAERDDAISEGMVILCQAALSWDPERSRFSTWACTKLYGGMKNYMTITNEKWFRQVVLGTDEFDSAGVNTEVEVSEYTDSCTLLLTLPDNQAAVVALLMAGYNCSEAARHLGIHRHTVRARLDEIQSALKRVKEK